MALLRSGWHFAWAFVSALRYGFPSRRLTVIGVTGTKGKSTTLEILSAMLEAAGFRTAVLSSVFVKIADKRERNLTGNSMPGRGFIQWFLRGALRKRCRFALIEVTSEGVLQHRHRFIAFDAAGITNLTPEHIEAHGSFAAYRNAKLAFFRAVLRSPKSPRHLFVEEGNEAVAPFAKVAPERTVLFDRADVVLPPGPLGELFATNIALAASIARTFGAPEEAIQSALRAWKGLPGRMEFVAERPVALVVDYAHTPDSLEKVYTTLKKDYAGLVCVFGAAGGGRDKWKRPVMGAVAAKHCRSVVLTEEDPYDEDPATIAKEIERGLAGERFSSYEIVLDRRKAIRRALALAKPGEAVVLTGKGSETGIHRAGSSVEPWDEAEEARAALRAQKK